MIEESAGIIVLCKGKILLLKHVTKREFCKPPKGLVEKGEDLEQAALRETKEETGLDVRIIPGFHEKIEYYYKKQGETVCKTVHYFAGTAENCEVKLSFEHQGFEWLEPGKAVERATFNTDKKALEKAVKFFKEKGLL